MKSLKNTNSFLPNFKPPNNNANEKSLYARKTSQHSHTLSPSMIGRHSNKTGNASKLSVNNKKDKNEDLVMDGH